MILLFNCYEIVHFSPEQTFKSSDKIGRQGDQFIEEPDIELLIVLYRNTYSLLFHGLNKNVLKNIWHLESTVVVFFDTVKWY